MYKIIDSKYCNDNFVLIQEPTHSCHLIISKDEIIYLKTKDRVIIDKCLNKQNNFLFELPENQNNKENVNVLFEYNKTYLNFGCTLFGDYCFGQNYFFRGSNRALHLSSPLPINQLKTNNKEFELSREEIERIFDKNMYDTMYVLDVYGNILFANNRVNGLVVDKKLIPSDEEIIEMELEDRIDQYKISRLISSLNKNQDNHVEAQTPKSIDKITNFNIYGSFLFRTFSHMLLTVTNDKFNLKWFRIDFIGNNKFKLTISDIPVIEITVDDLLNCHIQKVKQLQKAQEEAEKIET